MHVKMKDRMTDSMKDRMHELIALKRIDAVARAPVAQRSPQRLLVRLATLLTVALLAGALAALLAVALAPVRLVLGTAAPGTTAPGAGAQPGRVTLEGKQARAHLRVVGVTGSGKSKLLASLILQLLNWGIGVALLDPHGDLCDDILTALLDLGFFTDPRAYERLWYVDFSRTDRFVAWNVLKQPYETHVTARNLLESWKRAWSGLASGNAANLENVVLASAYALAATGEPLTHMQRLLTDSGYRERVLAHCPDPAITAFFHERYDALGRRANLLNESTLRRAFLLTFTPALRYALGQRENRLQFRALMDQGVTLLANLGGLDPDTQRMLGCLFTVGVEEAALSREDIPESLRRPYTLVVDEFSQFSAQSQAALERVLALTRKYGLSLVVANQTLSQTGRRLEGALQNAVQVVFRLGREDAAAIAPRLFAPDPYRLKERPDMRPTYMSAADQRLGFEQDLAALAPREAYVRLGEQTIKFRSLGLSAPQSAPAALEALKERYARLLLTPRSDMETGEAGEEEKAIERTKSARTGSIAAIHSARDESAGGAPLHQTQAQTRAEARHHRQGERDERSPIPLLPLTRHTRRRRISPLAPNTEAGTEAGEIRE